MNPSVRIGLSITALSIAVILASNFLFQLFPSEYKNKLEARISLCETLAMQFSLLIEAEKENQIQQKMDVLVNEYPEIISMGLRLKNDVLIAHTNQHPAKLEISDPDMSSETQAYVPIFLNNQEWAKLEVFFKPINEGLITTIINSPLLKLLLFFLTIGFFSYTFFIKRTLNYLDPSAVIPSRVKNTLDQLVEGVVLVDGSFNIVLANDAFSNMFNKSAVDLIGQNLNSFEWKSVNNGEEHEPNLPWVATLKLHERIMGQRIVLLNDEGYPHILSTNASLIKDGDNKSRGILVTFDDVGEIEKKNAELVKTIEHLEKAETKIREQNDELRRLASVDPLSGALNRRAFFEKLELEYKLAIQEHLLLSCIMVDIDHFKSINDNYGHAVGDEVIKGMSKILLERCIANGAVGRYGGEEFCLVLPGISTDEALKIAELIRIDLINWSIKKESPTSGKKITASLGQSSINQFALSGAAMVDQADQALYHSKETGRNRVTSWFDLPKQISKAG